MSLYLSGKIRAFDGKGHVAKLCIVILPLLVAALVGISRVDDYWHHWQDVFAGGLLGMLVFTLYSKSSKLVSPLNITLSSKLAGIVVSTICYLQFFPPPYRTEGKKRIIDSF